jgi:hypothetical protein
MKLGHLNQILPGTGRGTARRVVEGFHGDVCALADRRAPSVASRHLPVPGRNLRKVL